MTDAQLTMLWQDTNTTIWLIGKQMNQASFAELIGLYIGLLIVCSLIAAIFTRTYTSMGFRARD